MSLLLVVMAMAIQEGNPVGDVCGQSFFWRGEPGFVSVFPGSLVSLQPAPAGGRDGDDPFRARLMLDVGYAGLIGGKGAWDPSETGLKLTPPSIPLPPRQLETHIRFGEEQTAEINRTPRLYAPVEGSSHVEAWTEWSRSDQTEEAARMVRRFRSGGSVTIDLVASDGVEPNRILSSARFDWSDVEVLVEQVRAHYDGCPAT